MERTDGGELGQGRTAPNGPLAPGELERVLLGMAERLRRTAYRMVRDGHEAEDIAQEVILAAFRNVHRLRDPARLEGWLLRIARNLATTRRRRIGRIRPDQRLSGAEPDEVAERDSPWADLRSTEPGPDAVLAVRYAWDDIPDAWRHAFRARFEQGRTFHDIAAEQGVSVACVKTRLTRVRKRLLEAL
jgi:RNA polymerase sigma-70 factor (ECF subfamily)